MAEELTAEQILVKAKGEIKFLTSKRGHLKASLTRFQRFLDASTETLSSPDIKVQIETRLQAAKTSLNEFEKIQSGIEDIHLRYDLPEAEDQDDVRADFEEKYFSIISKATFMLQSFTPLSVPIPENIPLSSEPINNVTTLMTKLPPISIPEFSGSYESWTQFFETFESIIDKNPSLPKVQKFYYLQSALRGDAAQVISSLTASDDNYTIAWKLLKDRYQNKKAITHSHIKAIFNLPMIKEENHSSLRKFLDSFQKHFRCLENLGEKVIHWDTILIYLLSSKLSQITRREWEITSKNMENPTILDLTNFLTERCYLLESIDFKIYNKHESQSSKHVSIHKTFAHPAFENVCPLCKANHFVYSCKKFIDLSINDRYSEAKRLKLCTNCLRPGHLNMNCKSKHFCRTCKRNHHSLLHQLGSPRTFEVAVNPKSDLVRQASNNQSPQTALYTQLRVNPGANPNDINSTLPNPHSSNSLCNSRIVNSNQDIFDRNSTSSPHQPSSLNVLPDNSRNTPVFHQEECQNNPITNYSLACANSSSNNFILLSTVLIQVYDGHQTRIPCRALLDSGSQSNFISRSLFDKLSLKWEKINIPVCGINQGTTYINKRTMLTFQDLNLNYKFKISALVIDKITEECPQQVIDISKFPIPHDVQLADPTFYQPSEIDILLGASIFYELLVSGQIRLGKNNPILQNTLLGWVVSGPISAHQDQFCKPISCFSLNKNFDIELKNCLEKFWHIEEPIHEPNKLSQEELDCESHFVETVSRTTSGRFEVSLPFKKNISQIGSSREIAEKRFFAIERKFLKNKEFHSSYSQFIQEYELLGHMSKVDITKDSASVPTYYLPHHAVEKQDSTTTKLRVVFDASAKSTTGISLNDSLMVGPTIQMDLFSIIIRFREHNYVLTGDLAKMYRQILVKPCERNFQRIVWRGSPDSDLQHFQLNTVTYGTASASFLSTRCLKQVSLDKKTSFPNESRIIAHDFYVDDALTGSNDLNELVKIKSNLISIFQEYGFELRKLASNNPTVLSDIPDNGSIEYVINEGSSSKTLGISWNSPKDQFVYSSNLKNIPDVLVTKRSILAAISTIFDPLGLLGPIIIQGKILIQKLWLLKISWDEPVPSDFHKIWLNFSNQLAKANTFNIPRQVTIKNPLRVQIHGFSDASINAYGACMYVRSEDADGNIHCNLLCGKSRVAPLKAVSLPRLELCGALLLVKLVKKVTKILNYPISEIFYWTDSSIVLCWLSLEPRSLKTFVCNRIAEIQQLSDAGNWYHIVSSQNPADIISRGMTPTDLKNNILWWHGPQYLKKPEKYWPTGKHISNFARQAREISEIPEINPKSFVFIANPNIDFVTNICSRFSSYPKLINVVAYCRRFLHNLKNKAQRITGHLSPNEISQSTSCLIKLIQADRFPEEIFELEHNRGVKARSKLSTLNPFLDRSKILRVGGRLSHANIDFDYKHPIVLPHNHPFTELVVTHEHVKNLHPGSQTTLSFVRQQFWPLKGKPLIKRIIELHPGSDSTVRVVSVRTNNGVVKRAVNKLCPLPIKCAQVGYNNTLN
ncbi:uncharacterized protein LOC126748497 [Anthonomus grandis grandis]|uniref:uncharacterized protein LOC126748497 n=1 Tax=Anthonomus grandis grandis TaxID=2921223 RepID=UPI0021669933|nr:uncharacterized protein LOC126748497 [Anthonomus grandis grandis]